MKEGLMADDFNPQYDKPLFGAGGNWQDTGFGGSQATAVPDPSVAYDTQGTTMSSAFVVPNGGSTLNGDRISVGADATVVPLQADLYEGPDPNELSGGMTGDQVGLTGIGHGRTHFGGGSSK